MGKCELGFSLIGRDQIYFLLAPFYVTIMAG